MDYTQGFEGSKSNLYVRYSLNLCIFGGPFAKAKPKAAGIIMLISGIGGFIAISASYLFGGPLLILGGILALISSRSEDY